MVCTGMASVALQTRSARWQTRPAVRAILAHRRVVTSAQHILRRNIVRAQGDQEQQPSSSEQQQQQQQPASLDEEPIWVRRERERAIIEKEGKDLPFAVYLLLSAVVAIAAVGSVFEYTAQHAAFGVIQPDSPLYALTLGTFAVTGLPTSGYLFWRAIRAANQEAERMDKLDGY